MKLRDYQSRAVANIGRCLAESKSTLLALPTGCGKTVVLAHAIKEHCAGRAMVIAHREELITQNAKTIGSVLGQPCDIERADQYADLHTMHGKAKVIVASKDSLHKKRLERFDPSEFGMIVTDECVPAGTLVDGRPIESLVIGDMVGCVNPEADWIPVLRRVTRTFRQKPKKMVRITLSSGEVVCGTTNHPIWIDSQRRWKNSGDVTCGDMVSRLTTYGHKELHRLRQELHASSAQAEKNLLSPMPSTDSVESNGADQSEVRIGPHDRAEPDAIGVGSESSVGNTASNGAPAIRSRWQRDRTNRSREDIGGSARLDDRSDCSDRSQEDKCGTPAVTLQDRRGERANEDSCGNRRTIPQIAFSSRTGRKENRFLERSRVDRVEILESGSDGTFGGVCPDGFVYNLEVDEHNTYFANGVLVHNSHHAVAQSYRRVYDHFKNVPHLGVTATPDRLDEEALGQIYGSVAMVYEIADAIKDGWLVSVRARTVVVHDLDLSDVSTTGGDLNQGELAEQLERERSTHEMAASITKECDDRRAIVFAVTVRQARRMAEILNDYKPDCARWVSGETPTEDRRQTLAAHKRGECQFMVNVGVLTEGYDDPGVGMIVVARPTKSRALFAQMLGRGTRALPGVVDGPETAELRKRAIAESEKQDLLCLDFTGNCGRHKLITPADVLGGAFPDEDRAAVSLAMQAGIVDVDDELERARAARKNQGSKADQALYLSSKNRIVALASYMLKPEDLFDVEFTPGRERTWLMGKAPTDPQLDALERAGFKRADCERMSRTECSRLIGEIILRRQQGLCTLKQARCLSQRGVKNAGRLTFEQAREHLDRLYGSRV